MKNIMREANRSLLGVSLPIRPKDLSSHFENYMSIEKNKNTIQPHFPATWAVRLRLCFTDKDVTAIKLQEAESWGQGLQVVTLSPTDMTRFSFITES